MQLGWKEGCPWLIWGRTCWWRRTQAASGSRTSASQGWCWLPSPSSSLTHPCYCHQRTPSGPECGWPLWTCNRCPLPSCPGSQSPPCTGSWCRAPWASTSWWQQWPLQPWLWELTAVSGMNYLGAQLLAGELEGEFHFNPTHGDDGQLPLSVLQALGNAAGANPSPWSCLNSHWPPWWFLFCCNTFCNTLPSGPGSFPAQSQTFCSRLVKLCSCRGTSLLYSQHYLKDR